MQIFPVISSVYSRAGWAFSYLKHHLCFVFPWWASAVFWLSSPKGLSILCRSLCLSKSKVCIPKIRSHWFHSSLKHQILSTFRDSTFSTSPRWSPEILIVAQLDYLFGVLPITQYTKTSWELINWGKYVWVCYGGWRSAPFQVVAIKTSCGWPITSYTKQATNELASILHIPFMRVL